MTARLSREARELIERRSDMSVSASKIERIPQDVTSPLSFAQEMVWLATQLDKSTTAYNRCSALHIDGAVDVNALERAISSIVERHEVLRTKIVSDDGSPRLTVLPAKEIEIEVTDLTHVPEDRRGLRVSEHLVREARRSFDLDSGPWLRAGLIKETARNSTLFIITHHIASDGWSDGVMFSELHSLYEAFVNRRASPLSSFSIQHRDLSAWQRARSASREGERDAAYWKQRLFGVAEDRDWLTDQPKSNVESVAGGKVSRSIPADVVRSLEAVGKSQGATVAMVALAAFMLLKSRFTGQADTIVGLSLAGRTRPECEQLIGLFSVVVPIRVSIEPQMSFGELLRDVRTAVLDAHEHQQVPVDLLLSDKSPVGRAHRAEIASSLFNFRNMPAFPPRLNGVDVHPVEVFNETSVVPIDLEVVGSGDGWKCDLKFRASVYTEETACRLLGHYATLLESIVNNPDATLGRQSLLSPEELRQVTVDFSGIVRALPPRLRIEEMIRAQTLRTPEAIAVESAEGTIDYATLDERSDALAAHMRSRGVAEGDRIAICMNRSIELIVSLIAILKTGAAFVPLDPELPSRRLAYMVADTDPALIIVDESSRALIGATDPRVLLVDPGFLRELPAAEIPLVSNDPHAVACVLYTSGSTGQPKGVLSPHRGIANNLLALQELYPLTGSDCTLQHTSLGFDAAAWEIFWPLSVGARIHLAQPGGQRDADYLVRVIRDHSVAMIGASPSLLKVLLDSSGFAGCAHLKRVLAIGEVLSPSLQEKFYARMPHATLHNLYGPSETSITVTDWTCERSSKRRSVPIGRALPNVELLILDSEMQPVPIGVAGEIYIGGVAVAPGYHHRPELTAERFLPHPFRPESGERVYRTGDIARFDADGVIEYIGRRDHQLKIRGVRVELEEVQAALERLPAVNESVVVARRDSHGEHQLIAYVATDYRGPISELRRALTEELPPQFLPAVIVPSKALPHGPNGKIDRALLPDPSTFAPENEADSLPPTGDVEMRIASIWRELLSSDIASVRESFFNMGGHSLLAVRMVQRVDDEFGSRIRLREFYKDPTIEGLASLLAQRGPSIREPQRSPLIKVRARTARPTVFYFNGQPPGGGRYVHKMAPYLPADNGFYIAPIPLVSEPTTVEAIAERMIARIRDVNSDGPYVLAGNCFGAVLALEIAQQLEASGAVVSRVILVHPDALARTHGWFRVTRRLALISGVPEEFHHAEFSSGIDHTLRTVREIWRAERKIDGRERVDQIRNAGRWLRRFITSRVALKGDAPAGDDGKVPRLRHDRRPLADENDFSCESPDQELILHRHCVEEAWIKYTLRPYLGKVAIIWPNEGPSNPPWAPQRLWKHFTPNFDWKSVPGNHWSMLHDHFEHTALALGEFVSSAQ